MKIDVYIIKRNSPESRLLRRIGFDRNALEVAEWRGHRRSKGGIGKTPVAWRVTGEENVRKLCEGIIRIIGSIPTENIKPEEKKALNRAHRVLTAFENQARRLIKVERTKVNLFPIVFEFLRLRLPCASETDLKEIMSLVERDRPHTVNDLISCANDALGSRPTAWQRARTEIMQSIRNSMCDNEI